jgi:uncharacterized DUF497 family protein
MGFEWDEAKRRRNLREHGVDFIDVFPLFDGDVGIKERIDRRFDYGETRIRCLGEIEGRVYVVIYTWRGGNRRIISARKANVREQREYRSGNARRSTDDER